MSNKILLPQLVSMLSASSGKPKSTVETFIKVFFSVISDALENHDSVKIKDFGTFKISKVEARKSVNVSTGEEIRIPSHYKVTFSPAKALAESVNREFSWLEIVEISDGVSKGELEEVEPLKEKPTEIVEEIPSVQVTETAVKEKPQVEEPIEKVPQMETPIKEAPIEEMPIDEKQIKVAQPKNDPQKEDINKEEESIASIPVAEVTQSRTPKPVSEASSESVEEEKSERLGEELEKDFGDIEPVEPFGPVDPDDPEPGEPIPENVHVPVTSTVVAAPEITRLKEKKQTAEESPTVAPVTAKPEDKREREFDPYNVESKKKNPVPDSEDKNVINKEDLKDLPKRSDIKAIGKHIKKIRATIEQNEETDKKRALKYFLLGIAVSIVLITGGLFIFYGILINKGFTTDKNTTAKATVTETVVNENIDDEEIPVTVDPNISESVPQDTMAVSVGEKATEMTAAAETPAAPKEDNKKKTEPEKKEIADTKKKEEPAKQTAAPTSPSDIKATDKITNTRYLTTMAKEHYGNYNLWPYIYLENEGKLGHPDRIKPGTTIVIPNISKYGIDPSNPKDIEKARKLGVEIYRKNSK